METNVYSNQSENENVGLVESIDKIQQKQTVQKDELGDLYKISITDDLPRGLKVELYECLNDVIDTLKEMLQDFN